jgi:hypothetical protein
MADQVCKEVRELAPEVALGIASGDDRALVLTHLSSCPGCRGELEELAAIGDQLLLAAPAHEPPIGFESKVLQRMTRGRRHTVRTPRRLAWMAAAVLVAASAGAGALWWGIADDRDLASSYRRTLSAADGRYFAAVPLRSAEGDDAAVVFAYAGEPSWIFITIEDGALAGTYRVEARSDSGDTVPLGEATLASVDDGWGTQVDLAVQDIASFRLVRSDGLTLAGRFGHD